MPIRTHPLDPAPLLANRHLQTIVANLRGPKLTVPLERETVELPDGDFVHIDWAATTGPTLLILHGLEGSARSVYVRALMQDAVNAGWRPGLLYFRGCSGVPNRLERSYNAADTGDLAQVLEQLSSRDPAAPRVAVGYSLGGSVLLNYLGEYGEHALLERAVAVSVPFDLAEAAAQIDTGFSRFYQSLLLKNMRRTLLERLQLGLVPNSYRRGLKARSIRAFDDWVTAPLHGYADAADYYKRGSCRQRLNRIEVPTLVLHALDDPFMTPAVVPGENELAPAVQLELYDRGGHVGFLGRGPGILARRWLEPRILAALPTAMPLAG